MGSNNLDVPIYHSLAAQFIQTKRYKNNVLVTKQPIHFPFSASSSFGKSHSNLILFLSQMEITIFNIEPKRICSKLAQTTTGLSSTNFTTRKFDAMPSYKRPLSSIKITSLTSFNLFFSKLERSLTHCEFFNSGVSRSTRLTSTLTLLFVGTEGNSAK